VTPSQSLVRLLLVRHKAINFVAHTRRAREINANALVAADGAATN
jgi:hypothetical protein